MIAALLCLAALGELPLGELHLAPGPQHQGVQYEELPRGWVSVGLHAIAGDYDAPFGADSKEDPGYSVDLGLYNWNGDLGVGLETGLAISKYRVQTSALFEDEVDTVRVLLGVRLVDRMDGGRFWPYVRGGYMYRNDNGSVIGDHGHGFYVGGGVEIGLFGPVALSPQILYTESGSLNATEWIFGGTLTLRL